MKAVLKNGVIYPQEAVPEEWPDGTELRVERLAPDRNLSGDSLDRWMAKVQDSANDTDPEDEVILEKAIREVREQARAFA